MAVIYGRAQRVVVWLGPEKNNSSLALKALERLGENVFIGWDSGYVSEIRDQYSTENKSGPVLLDRWEFGNTDTGRYSVIKSYNTQEWEAVCRLVGRGWFKRVWIWQEVAFANDNAIIVSGHSSLLWNTFKKAVICLQRNVERRNTVAPSTFLFQRDLMLASKVAATWPYIGILSLLNVTRASLCSDPRDRIFSMLRLAADRERLRFEPDYGRSTASVYTIFALAYIGRFNTLDILAECDSQAYEGTPTWVPNWDSRPLYNRMVANHAGGGAVGVYDYIGKGQLKVNNVYCGKIVYCGKPVPFDASPDTVRSIVQTWEPRVFNENCPGGGLVLDAFISLLVCGALSPQVLTHSCPTKAEAAEAFWQDIWS
jgi:hypothetical protein